MVTGRRTAQCMAYWRQVKVADCSVVRWQLYYRRGGDAKSGKRQTRAVDSCTEQEAITP